MIIIHIIFIVAKPELYMTNLEHFYNLLTVENPHTLDLVNAVKNVIESRETIDPQYIRYMVKTFNFSRGELSQLESILRNATNTFRKLENKENERIYNNSLMIVSYALMHGK